MKIQKVSIDRLKAAEYNPRKDLKPGDKEYEKIARSIDEFGYVEPIIWNENTSNVVGGHQRLKILKERGYKEVDVTVVNISEHEEKILNVALNKITGRWETGKLSDLLTELQEAEALEATGFEDWEVEALKIDYDHIQDLLNEEFSEWANKVEKETFTMTFSIPEEHQEAVQSYINSTSTAKTDIATAVINKVKGVL